MAGRDGRRERAARVARRTGIQLGEELRSARLSTGLSLDAVAGHVGMSPSKVGRLERGVAGSIELVDLTAIASVVGLDLSVRLYPGPRPVRDVAHARLVGRFGERVHPGLAMRTEVSMDIPGDQRAWDAVLFGDAVRVAIEAENRLGDLQALERRIELKRRDSGIASVVLVVADTRHNRDVLRAAGNGALRSFPLPGRAVLRALAEGRDPGGSGIVVL